MNFLSKIDSRLAETVEYQKFRIARLWLCDTMCLKGKKQKGKSSQIFWRKPYVGKKPEYTRKIGPFAFRQKFSLVMCAFLVLHDTP